MESDDKMMKEKKIYKDIKIKIKIRTRKKKKTKKISEGNINIYDDGKNKFKRIKK